MLTPGFLINGELSNRKRYSNDARLTPSYRYTIQVCPGSVAVLGWLDRNAVIVRASCAVSNRESRSPGNV